MANAYSYQFKVMATDNAGARLDSVFSDVITIVDTPVLSVNGADSIAAARWRRPGNATSYTLRWRKLGADNNGRAHSSRGWLLDDSSLPRTYGPIDVESGIPGSQTSFTIRSLGPRQVYAIQLNYLTADGWVFSARDAYVWPASTKPRAGERVAGYPFFGHFADKTYRYRICGDTFYPDDPVKQEAWIAVIESALEQWETATGGFIQIVPEHTDPGTWADPGTPEYESCTEFSWWRWLLGQPWEDDLRSEIRMVTLPALGVDVRRLSTMDEMLLDPFKLCVVDAYACSTSLSGYGRLVRQSGTTIPSADITFNANKLEGASPTLPDPDGVRFNACVQGGKPKQTDNRPMNIFFPYALVVHESGHALGLSDWTLSGTQASVTIPAFNTIVGLINTLVVGDLPTIPESLADLAETAIYEASHPTTPDSVLNYDWQAGVDEPDCSPHPLDIMAIYALYQSD